jgi:hypothetical protein
MQMQACKPQLTVNRSTDSKIEPSDAERHAEAEEVVKRRYVELSSDETAGALIALLTPTDNEERMPE